MQSRARGYSKDRILGNQISEYCANENFELIKIYRGHELEELIKDIEENEHIIILDLFPLLLLEFLTIMEESDKKKAHVIYLSHPDINVNTSIMKHNLTIYFAAKELVMKTGDEIYSPYFFDAFTPNDPTGENLLTFSSQDLRTRGPMRP
jgi:hypothetical protein